MSVRLSRIYKTGKSSFVMGIDKHLRAEMGVTVNDVIAFRVVMVQGTPMLVGQKVPLAQLAQVKEMPVSLLKKAVGRSEGK